jgi:hypothetical protein
MTTQLLIEEFGPVRFQLVESDGGGLVAEGEFGYCDKPTSNGRVYPRKIMEREIERLRPKMETGALFGELDHPEDGKTKLQRAAMIIEDMRIAGDGRVTGRFRVMEGTPNGDTLAAIVRAGGKVGVSSRGIGSTVTEGSSLVVQEDFRLFAYDAVAEPAVSSALPAFNEGGGRRGRGSRGMREDHDHQQSHNQRSQPRASQSSPRYLSDREVDDLIESEDDVFAPHSMLQLVESITKSGASNSAAARELAEARKELAEKNLLLQRSASKLVQEHDERVALEEELAQVEEELDQVRKQHDLTKHTLWTATTEALINAALPQIHSESREHFLRLIGKPTPGSSVRDLESRINVQLEEFERTGRAVHLDADLFLERTELLALAGQKLSELEEEVQRARFSDDLLAESADELTRLSAAARESEGLRTKLAEAADMLTRMSREAKQLERRATKAEEGYATLSAHVELLEGRVESAEKYKRKLAATEMDNFKLQRCLSAQYPKRMYEALRDADTKEQITEAADTFLRTTRAAAAREEGTAARPPQLAGTGTSQHMPMTEENAVIQRMQQMSVHRGKNSAGTSSFVESAATPSLQHKQQGGASAWDAHSAAAATNEDPIVARMKAMQGHRGKA